MEAAASAKMQELALDKSQKMASRTRLQADPNIAVADLQRVFQDFLVHKANKDLWGLIMPPPTGPMSYGWHTQPCSEWIMKTAGLLFECVGLAQNTKLHSAKVQKCLRAMHDAKDLELRITKTKSMDNCIDQIDLTLRILLNMIRTLKCNRQHRQRVLRSLCKAEQVKLELILQRVVLPPEVMALASEESLADEDAAERPEQFVVCKDNVCPNTLSTEGAIVPYVPPKEPTKPDVPRRLASTSFLAPLPSIFAKILGSSAESASTKTPAQAKPDVLNMAMQHQPAQAAKDKKISKDKAEPKKPAQPLKALKKTKNKKDQKPLAKKSSSNQTNGNKKKSVAKDATSTYEAGKFWQAQKDYVMQFMDQAAINGTDATRKDAMKSWQTSAKRAGLLAGLSVSELKRRKFVPKGTTSNPFAEIVNAVPDVD